MSCVSPACTARQHQCLYPVSLNDRVPTEDRLESCVWGHCHPAGQLQPTWGQQDANCRDNSHGAAAHGDANLVDTGCGDASHGDAGHDDATMRRLATGMLAMGMPALQMLVVETLAMGIRDPWGC